MRALTTSLLVTFASISVIGRARADEPRGSPSEAVAIQGVQVTEVAVDPVRTSPVSVSGTNIRGVEVQHVEVSGVSVGGSSIEPVSVRSVSIQGVTGTSRPGASPAPGSGTYYSTRTTWDLPVSLTIAPTFAPKPPPYSLTSVEISGAAKPRVAAPVAKGSTPVSVAQVAASKTFERPGSEELWSTPVPGATEDEDL